MSLVATLTALLMSWAAALVFARSMTLFLKQVVRQGGLPFDERAPKVKARRPEREVGKPAWRPRAKRRPPAEDALAPFFELCRKGAEEGRRKWKEALGEG